MHAQSCHDAYGEHLRRRYGIDGTAGDAQDVEHPYHAATDGSCLVCGLAEVHRKHIGEPA